MCGGEILTRRFAPTSPASGRGGCGGVHRTARSGLRGVACTAVQHADACRSSPASPSMAAIPGGRAIRFDALVRTAFRRDKRRDKGFGPALGAAAPLLLSPRTSSAPSDWRIPRTALRMQRALIDGIADAARNARPARADAITAWQESAAAPGAAREACHNHRPPRHTGAATGRMTPCCWARSPTISPARPISAPCWCAAACAPCSSSACRSRAIQHPTPMPSSSR